MASSRPALPELKEVETIFEKYKNTLTAQPRLKKYAIAAVNTVRAYIPSNADNPFIQYDLETIKDERIKTYQTTIQSALKSDAPVPELITVIKELNDDFENIKNAEFIHDSKFGLALRAVMTLLCSYLQDHEEFQQEITKTRIEFQKVSDDIKEAERKGYDPKVNTKLIKKRDQLITELANLGDLDAIHQATNEFNIFDKYPHPGDTFKPKVPYRKKFSPKIEIIYNIPWIYQPLFHEIFPYRLDHHEFPSKEAWDQKRKADVESPDKIHSDSISADESKRKEPASEKKSEIKDSKEKIEDTVEISKEDTKSYPSSSRSLLSKLSLTSAHSEKDIEAKSEQKSAISKSASEAKTTSKLFGDKKGSKKSGGKHFHSEEKTSAHNSAP